LRGTLSAFYNDGDSFSARIGDIQIASNIEADDGGVRLNEAWLEQALPWGESSLLMGKYDLNGEFDVLDAALPFVNSAFGIGTDIGASGPNGPSIYPATGLALRLRVALSDDLSLKLVAADGLPGDLDRPGRTRVALDENQGALLVAELARRGPRSRVLAGYWRYTRQRLPLCADLAACDQGQGNDGLYLRGERVLHDGASGRRWQAFFRLGSAASAYNPLDRFVSAGLLATGLLQWFAVGKPAAYYTGNGLFHGKLTLFPVVANFGHAFGVPSGSGIPKSLIAVGMHRFVLSHTMFVARVHNRPHVVA